MFKKNLKRRRYATRGENQDFAQLLTLSGRQGAPLRKQRGTEEDKK